MAATNFGRVAVMCCIIYIAELSIVLGTGILVFFFVCLFFQSGFSSQTLTIHGTAGEGREP